MKRGDEVILTNIENTYSPFYLKKDGTWGKDMVNGDICIIEYENKRPIVNYMLKHKETGFYSGSYTMKYLETFCILYEEPLK